MNEIISHIHLAPDDDGIYRSLPVVIAAGERSVPALALATFLCAARGTKDTDSFTLRKPA